MYINYAFEIPNVNKRVFLFFCCTYHIIRLTITI